MLCGAVGVAAAADPPTNTLAAAMELAWRLHPEAAALEAREQGARAAQELAAGVLPGPAALSFGHANDRFNRNRGKQEWELELAAPLWLPGQQAARADEALSHVDELAARRAALRWELAGELREAWWALAAARQTQALALRRLDTARALEQDVRRRYQAGELSRIDANLAQSEVLAAQAESVEAEAMLLQSEQTLRLLTGAQPPTELAEEAPAPVPRTNPREESREPIAVLHPHLAAAAAAVRSARARLKATEATARAAPKLALRVQRERGDFNEEYANRLGIELTLPFASTPQRRRETAAAQAEVERVEAEMRRAAARWPQEKQRAQHALEAAERQLLLAQVRQAFGADNLSLSEKAFALGESDLATLLRMRATAYDAHAALDRQRVARAAAISRLNQSLGVTP